MVNIEQLLMVVSAKFIHELNLNKMKKEAFVGIIIFSIYLISCSTYKEPAYSPPEAARDKEKPFFTQRFAEGKILYNNTCTNCHTSKVYKEKGPPLFTLEQLEAYSIRISNDTHSEKLNAKDLTDQELSKILFYLRFLVNEQYKITGTEEPEGEGHHD